MAQSPCLRSTWLGRDERKPYALSIDRADRYPGDPVGSKAGFGDAFIDTRLIRPEGAAALQHQDRVLTFCHCARRQECAPKITRTQVRVFINPARLCNLAKNSASWLRFSPRKVNLSRSALADMAGGRRRTRGHALV